MAQRPQRPSRGPSTNALLSHQDLIHPDPYASGRPPPTNNDNLLREHDIPTSATPHTPVVHIEPSSHVSTMTPSPYQHQHQHHQSPNSATALRADVSSPHYLSTNDRLYSQTSILGNHQRYSDVDDFPDDQEAHGYYASSDIEDDSFAQPTHDIPASYAPNRSSFMAIGGGLMGKAKDMLGIGPTYSDMDLPLRKADPTSHDQSSTPITSGPVPLRKRSARSRPFCLPWSRGAPDPATLGPRIIHLNDPPANSVSRYADNHVSTAKYNIATFPPKFLFEQFSKYANLFFLFTAAIQQIPNISPTSRYTTIVPLGIVLVVSAVKELIEDSRRKSQDRQLNISNAKVLRGDTFHDTQWLKVVVGDVVRVHSEEPFPADLVLLASSEPEGLCYIETANLDGETNLKIKQAIPETAHLVVANSLARLAGTIKSEQPNSSLYTYEATLTTQTASGLKELALGPDQLLLRGATLRNTPWVHAVVVFTGHETKLMRNATATPIKKTAIEHTVNSQILLLGAILVALSIISSVGDLIVRAKAADEVWYVDYTRVNAASQFFGDFFTYWVLYSNLVPISLFVTVELIKYWQALLISSDLDMYYDKTNTPANCRTSSLVEELGQVEYVFSDKTGTLTCNQMDFRQCSIAGIQYADDIAEDKKANDFDGSEDGVYDFARLRQNLATHRTRDCIHHFLALLSTCHTVIPETSSEKGNIIKYQAASPDEGALVEGAVTLGYKFVARKPRAVMIEINGERLEYELLAVCEFNSTRKRMSAIFRCPDGRIRCYCKGADTVILERLGSRTGMVEVTLQHLEDYASEGLRTLCLAMREISKIEFQEWHKIWNKATTCVSGNRAEELDSAAALIEHDFELLGATAIEDKLQDGVPDTIQTLQAAGIKVWVLTGDRQETAINIGMSCKLISEDMNLLVINEENAADTRSNIERKLAAIQTQTSSGSAVDTLALVIDGKSLTYALERGLEKTFLDLAVMCKAVICCRVSPLQKALVVKLVKRHRKSILLAIGDGANDVSMIQAAHIGIGISGVEGLQAARSADVSIAQFRYLRKLLLVHGSWSYQRISKVILYFYYKNTAFFMTQFWFSWTDLFSGETIYESWTLSLFNVLFTALPPFVLGIFDQYVSARLLDRYPQLYTMSQKGYFFKTSSFWSWVINGFYHSLILFVASAFIYGRDLPMSNGTIAGHWVWGVSLYTAALVTTLGKAALVTNAWTKYTVVAIPGSLAVWFTFFPVYATVAPRLGFSTEYWNVLPVVMTSPVFWLQMIVLPVLCLTRDFAWKYAKRMYYPQPYHHVQEIQKFNVQDYRPRMEQFQKAIRKVRQVQRMQKQRGYAFSQADESQSRVLEAYDTTRERGRLGEMASSRR